MGPRLDLQLILQAAITYKHLICRNVICQPSAIAETRVKQRAFAFKSCWFVRHPAPPPPKVLYLRSLMHPLYTLSLSCPSYSKSNFLSFHMSLVVVMNCGAGNTPRGFEISMFYFLLKLCFIHISKDILPLRALNAKNNVNDIFPESRNVRITKI